jgi:hypothetical protein
MSKKDNKEVIIGIIAHHLNLDLTVPSHNEMVESAVNTIFGMFGVRAKSGREIENDIKEEEPSQ